MNNKTSNRKKQPSKVKSHSYWNDAVKTFKKHQSVFLLSIFYFIFLIALIRLEYKSFIIHETINKIRAVSRDSFKKFTAKYIHRPKLAKLRLKIKKNDFEKLANERNQALSAGILISSPDSFIPVELINDGERIPAEIRLKGILPDHWSDKKKWSLKVKLENGKTVMGMQHFSLLHPATRDYLYEWLFTLALKREDLLAPRVEFINLYVNDQNLGLFILEEDIDTLMLEDNSREPGPVVSFSKDLLIKEWARNFARGDQFFTPGTSGEFMAAPVEPAGTTGNHPATTQAITTLESFRQGKISVSQAFDIRSLAKSFALRAIFASQELDPNDIKFYYDPSSEKFEPIGSELSFNRRVSDWWLNQISDSPTYTPFHNLFFSDPEFWKQYLVNLSHFSKPEYLNQLLNELDGQLQQNLQLIYQEYPQFYFDRQALVQNQQYIRDTLHPIKGLHAYFHQSRPGQLELSIGNIQPLPIEILHASYKDIVLTLKEDLILNGKKSADSVNYQVATFTFPANFVWQDSMSVDLKVHYQILGIEEERNEIIFPWQYSDETVN